jgi:hypothetical protein
MKNKNNHTQHEAAENIAQQQMGEVIELKSVAPSARLGKGQQGR